jgi:hypothetical protein
MANCLGESKPLTVPFSEIQALFRNIILFASCSSSFGQNQGLSSAVLFAVLLFRHEMGDFLYRNAEHVSMRFSFNLENGSSGKLLNGVFDFSKRTTLGGVLANVLFAVQAFRLNACFAV